MKILVVRPGPSFSVEDVANGWIKGLRHQGHEVYDWDLGARLEFFAKGFEALGVRNASLEDVARNATIMLEGACWEYKPDLIIVITGSNLPPAFFDRSRAHCPVVLMITESPYEDDRHFLMAEHCDALVVNDTVNLGRFNEITPSFYYGHGFDPDIHKPGLVDPDLISEFCFVGTGFPERIEVFESIDWTNIVASFGGNWQMLKEGSSLRDLLIHNIDDCIANDDAVRLYQSSLLSANLYRKQATYSHEGESCGPREIEMAACGLFFLRESRKESDQLFKMLPTFSNVNELGNQIRWWLDHPEERQHRADLAREAVQPRNFNLLAGQFISDLQTI